MIELMHFLLPSSTTQLLSSIQSDSDHHQTNPETISHNGEATEIMRMLDEI